MALSIKTNEADPLARLRGETMTEAVRSLYVGNDFSRTDIVSALAQN
jgi:hypothetical protein